MIKYQHFALNNLFLANGYIETHSEYGIEREYEREDELEQCIRRIVLRKPEPLRGWDLRFLRRGIELSQADFGKTIDRDAQTIARWEKSAEPIPKFVDLMVRARFAERFEPQIMLVELLRIVDGASPALPSFIQLSLTQNGWNYNFGSLTFFPTMNSLSFGSAGLPSVHGPVQVVFNTALHLNSDQSDQSATFLEKISMPLLSAKSYKPYSNLATQSISAIQMPAFVETLYSRTLQ